MLAEFFNPWDLLVKAVAILPALTFHEFAHAWAAYRAGDDTAYRMGRCSLNPLVHLDPLGTIMLFFGPIGWAKPVPVNVANLRRWPRDHIIVSLAGIATNAISAIIWTVLYALAMALIIQKQVTEPAQAGKLLYTFYMITYYGITYNIALALFNLLPIPPLDGSHVLERMLKGQAAMHYAKLRKYGPGLIIAFVIINFYYYPIFWKTVYLIADPLRSLGGYLAGPVLSILELL